MWNFFFQSISEFWKPIERRFETLGVKLSILQQFTLGPFSVREIVVYSVNRKHEKVSDGKIVKFAHADITCFNKKYVTKLRLMNLFNLTCTCFFNLTIFCSVPFVFYQYSIQSVLLSKVWTIYEAMLYLDILSYRIEL